MAPSIEVIEPVLFAGVVADEIVATIAEAVAERGSCAVALAGGSTPSAIYRCLAKPPRVSEVDWVKVKLFWGDERWVPRGDTQSNFKMTHETLLGQISGTGPKIFPVPTDEASPAAGAAAYAATIRRELGDVPVFDLVILGIGEDGHTASIFPHSPVLQGGATVCAAVEQPEEKKPRITLTPDVLFGARRIIFIVKNDSKADIMKRVLEGPESIDEIPSKLYTRAADRTTFFLDSGAAVRLARSTVG